MGNQFTKVGGRYSAIKGSEVPGADDEDKKAELELAQQIRLQQLLSRANEIQTRKEKELKQLREEHRGQQEDLELFRKWKEETIRKLEKEGQIRMTWISKLVLLKQEGDLKRSASEGAKAVRRKEKEVDRHSMEIRKKIEELRKPLQMLALKEVELQDDGRKSTLPLLPVEIWTVIFGNLTDPKDLWNCTNACQVFNEILEDWKTKWMFEVSLPYLYPHLSKQKVLECRLVSKGWNSVVDHFFEEHPSVRAYGNDIHMDRRILPFVNPLREKDLDGVNDYSFTPDPAAPPPGFPSIPGRNPFIGRAVTLNVELNSSDEEEDMRNGKLRNRQIWDNVYSFLGTYGNEVWYLKVSATWGEAEAEGLDGEDLSAEAVEKVFQFFLRDLCTLVPNTRSLSIKLFPYTFLNAPDPWISKFPYLETLSITHASNILGRLIAIDHCQQLQSLRVSADTWYILHDRWWRKLRALRLDYMDFYHFAELRQSKRHIPQLGFLEINLMVADNNLPYWDFDLCQRAVNKLCSVKKLKTLRMSEITFSGDSLFQGHGKTLSIMPPSLTTLEFEYSSLVRLQVPTSFTFLLRFPFLQNMHVFWRSHRPGGFWQRRNGIGFLDEREYTNQVKDFQESKEIVEVNKYMFRKEMYKSNIWELLPRLNVFSFQWDVYTRTGYEQFVAQQKRSENKSTL